MFSLKHSMLTEQGDLIQQEMEVIIFSVFRKVIAMKRLLCACTF